MGSIIRIADPPAKFVMADMNAVEARMCVDRVCAHFDGARALLLELHERHGWKALGYASWRECVSKEFHQSASYLYRQLTAARIEKELFPEANSVPLAQESGEPHFSPIGEKLPIGEKCGVPEAVLRPLSGLTTPEERREAWDEAVARSNQEIPVAAVVEVVVAEMTGTADEEDDDYDPLPPVAEDPSSPQPKPKRKPREKQEEVKDALGTVVPANLRDVFADAALAEEANRVLAWMKAVQYESVTRQIAKRRHAYPYIPVEAIGASLEESHEALQCAAELIQHNLPHAVCPKCHGAGKVGDAVCPACKHGCGYVTASGLDNLRLAEITS